MDTVVSLLYKTARQATLDAYFLLLHVMYHNNSYYSH